MVHTAVTVYLIAWVVTSAGVYLASRRLGDTREPVPHQFALSAVAGALWPFLLLGAVEFSSVAVCASAASHLQSEPAGLGSTGVVPLR